MKFEVCFVPEIERSTDEVLGFGAGAFADSQGRHGQEPPHKLSPRPHPHSNLRPTKTL